MKKGRFFLGDGSFLWGKEGEGAWRRGAGAPERGCHWKKAVSAALPYRLSFPKTVHLFTMGDKVLWILLLGVNGHGSRGITGWFITRARTRTLYVCHVFWETGLPAGWQGFEGRSMTENPETEDRVMSEWNGNYGTVHFRNKRGRKKRYLTFKKVRLTFWKVKLTFLKVSRTLKTGVFKALIVHFRNYFPCRGIHKRHGYLKEKSRQDGVEWNISRGRKVYFGVFQRPLRFRWYGMYEQVRWRGVKEQVKDDHSPLK